MGFLVVCLSHPIKGARVEDCTPVTSITRTHVAQGREILRYPFSIWACLFRAFLEPTRGTPFSPLIKGKKTGNKCQSFLCFFSKPPTLVGYPANLWTPNLRNLSFSHGAGGCAIVPPRALRRRWPRRGSLSSRAVLARSPRALRPGRKMETPL